MADSGPTSHNEKEAGQGWRDSAGKDGVLLSRTGVLDEVIRRARRRCLRNLVFTQVVHAACVAMGGVVLLLLLGTQILDWPWLLALLGASFGLGFHWIARRLPSPYLAAQVVDRSLELDDTLSTAFFYSRMGNGRRVSEDMRAAQLAAAERLSREVDVRRAVPFRAPRSVYLMAGLAAVASSLFALRYGVSRSLDLRASLPRIVLDAFGAPMEQQARAKRGENKQRLQELLKQFGLSLEDQEASGKDTIPATALDAADRAVPLANPQEGAPKPLQVRVEEAKTGDPMDGSEGAGEDQAGDRLASDDGDSGKSDQSNPTAADKKPPNSPGEDSLLDKFREAMANLLSRLKTQPKTSDSQMASSAQARQDLAQARQGQGQKSSAGQGRQPSDGLPNSASQGNEESDGLQKASNGPGKRGGEDSDLQAAKEGRSGIGKEDGSKALREAEQLAAMGKITEIFGKRSQNLTGEVMVEVASGKQQLRTPYSQQDARHAEAGGEIHRDEIPLAYQRYVQQYFEEVRKPAAKK